MTLQFGKKYWALVFLLGVFVLALAVMRFGVGNGSTGLFLGPASNPQGIGDPQAAHKVLFYCDYETYYCLQANELAKSMVSRDANLFFEFKQFPQDNKPFDYSASIAATCAQNQGFFHSMHELLLKSYSVLSDEKIVQLAGSVEGLDMVVFNDCFSNEKTKQAVFTDIADAQASGIEYVPSFAYNGSVASGTNMSVIEERINSWFN